LLKYFWTPLFQDFSIKVDLSFVNLIVLSIGVNISKNKTPKLISEVVGFFKLLYDEIFLIFIVDIALS